MPVKTTTITDPISFVVIGDVTIAVRDVSTGRTVSTDENGNKLDTPAYRVFMISGGWVDLPGVTADGFASLLAGAAF
jgi:hypothetical protein